MRRVLIVAALLAVSVSVSAQWTLDRTPPAVQLTAPASGAVVSNAVTISATATDNVRVFGVQFYVDGVAVGAEDRTAPYAQVWNTTSATDGVHTIRVRARDWSNNVAIASVAVTVRNSGTAPRCSLAFWPSAPSSATAGQPVSFSVYSWSNCAGTIGYVWTFGDGVGSTLAKPSHTYSAGGTYTWSVTASVAGVTSTKSGTITVQAAPSCSLSLSASVPASAAPGEVVPFSAAATPSNCSGTVTYAWAFGDGATAIGGTTSHAYATAGNYQWSVSSSVSGVTSTKTGTITVQAPACSLLLTPSVPATATPGQAVPFSVTATPSNCAGTVTYAWAFGDGGTAATSAASHAYTTAGAYQWSVTASIAGVTSARTGTVTVSPPGTRTPVVIGSQIAGTFADATGHSAQSHLVYAANAGVWWLFTLTSAADAHGAGNHIVKAYRSSGADLATATWTAAADSPNASIDASVYCMGCFMGDGRALSVAYLNNSPTDVVHAEIAMASDGANGLVAHIRAVVTASTVTWEPWNYHDEPTATWYRPRAGAVGVSTGKFIHTANPILQQEIDANARKSVNADTGSAWVSGFSAVSVIDNSMFHSCNSFAFAPLANNAMLAVYDNGGGAAGCYNCAGGVPEPNLSNLGYKRSNADGSWPGVPVGSQKPGDGSVFSTDATIDQNDWALVAADTQLIGVFRRNAGGTGVDAAAYDAGTNTWASEVAPPAFGAGQSFKSGAGLFAVVTGPSTAILFVVNTDAANSVLYTAYDGTGWSAWATVPGTETGQHTRGFISGYYDAAHKQIGLIWTEGKGPYDVVVTSMDVSSLTGGGSDGPEAGSRPIG
jgi:PKD repeat protein